MNFTFEWQEQYLMSKRSERLSKILFLPREHKIHIFELTCNVLFILIIKVSDDGFFDDSPKISDHFLKISEDFPKLFQRPDERSLTFSENFQRLPKTFEEDRKMFR